MNQVLTDHQQSEPSDEVHLNPTGKYQVREMGERKSSSLHSQLLSFDFPELAEQHSGLGFRVFLHLCVILSHAGARKLLGPLSSGLRNKGNDIIIYVYIKWKCVCQP